MTPGPFIDHARGVAHVDIAEPIEARIIVERIATSRWRVARIVTPDGTRVAGRLMAEQASAGKALDHGQRVVEQRAGAIRTAAVVDDLASAYTRMLHTPPNVSDLVERFGLTVNAGTGRDEAIGAELHRRRPR